MFDINGKRALRLIVLSLLAGAFGCNDGGGRGGFGISFPGSRGGSGAGGGVSISTGGVTAPPPSTSVGVPSADLGMCDSHSLDPCSVFETPRGEIIQLGPYGSVIDRNVGRGFENAVALGDADGGVTCALFAGTFGEDPTLTSDLLDTSGRGTDEPLNFALYTVFRPANMVDGETYPVITWGNGTCAQPGGYSALLRYVASYGFIVVAANSRWVGGGAEMRRGIDFIFAENDNPQSALYQRVDTNKVGAMGHSQGGLGTSTAASDPRIDAVILWNGGTSASKPFLAVSGDLDIGSVSASSMRSAVRSAPKAAFLYYHDPAGSGSLRGHLVLMMEPERVVEAAAAWWQLILNNDAQARQMFVGSNCGLCNQRGFEFGQNGL